jgi:hypothetical protein
MIQWDIPFEAVRALANAEGSAILVNHALRHATFGAQAKITLINDRFVGEFTFEDPKYPGRQQCGAVQLVAVPAENASAVLTRGVDA